jgi:hypothetical protein
MTSTMAESSQLTRLKSKEVDGLRSIGAGHELVGTKLELRCSTGYQMFPDNLSTRQRELRLGDKRSGAK